MCPSSGGLYSPTTWMCTSALAQTFSICTLSVYLPEWARSAERMNSMVSTSVVRMPIAVSSRGTSSLSQWVFSTGSALACSHWSADDGDDDGHGDDDNNTTTTTTQQHREPPVMITKLLDDVHTVVGEKVEFEVEVSEEGAHVKWMKDGEELTKENAGSRYKIKKDGKRHMLIINEATTDDIGTYYAVTTGGESKAELEVWVAVVVVEVVVEMVMMVVEVVVETVMMVVVVVVVVVEVVVVWGGEKELEVLQSIADLTLKAAEQAVFKCEVSDEKVTGKWFKDGVEIHLDTGTGNKNTIVVVAGNRLRLDVEITGEPAPIACWKRGNVGAVRADEGKCSIVVTNAAGEDKAEVYIKIIDIPDGPENVRCTSVGEDSAVITWDPPAYDGGVPLKGYLMERRKVGSDHWTKLNFDVLEGTTYEAKKMIEGVLYEMRVFAVNGIGVSPPSANSTPFMPIGAFTFPHR
ncbi:LOW QUALITY PROTEIN: hypothetical protein CRUP_009267 [Coryphaenoides rupestris]|nr:LOW QUALITY PROTEIN: hypothetical protein CRUP_009267 [Coryphaenoides rupestris]